MNGILRVVGYGSLLEDWERYSPGARGGLTVLRGFRRSWLLAGSWIGVHRADPDAWLNCVVFETTPRGLASLDRRETLYQREGIEVDGAPAFVYAVAPERLVLPTRQRPIHASYLGCILDGFERMGGRNEAMTFLQTTRQWGPIGEGLPPRHVRLLVDAGLGEHVDPIDTMRTAAMVASGRA